MSGVYSHGDCAPIVPLRHCDSMSQECLLSSCNNVKEGIRHSLARECRTLITANLGLKKPGMCEVVRTNFQEAVVPGVRPERGTPGR